MIAGGGGGAGGRARPSTSVPERRGGREGGGVGRERPSSGVVVREDERLMVREDGRLMGEGGGVARDRVTGGGGVITHERFMGEAGGGGGGGERVQGYLAHKKTRPVTALGVSPSRKGNGSLKEQQVRTTTSRKCEAVLRRARI